MVTFGSLTETATELRKYTKQLYASLEAETGHATGFKPVGFIELASDAHRLEEYRRIATSNRARGVAVREISPSDVQALFPLCRTDDLLAGFYVEDDGRVNPVDACVSLAKGARMHGATIVEGVRVTGVTVDGGGGGNARVTGVVTAGGQTIRAGKVVNCAGMWARQLAAQAGVICPNQAAEHYYLVTDSMPEVRACACVCCVCVCVCACECVLCAAGTGSCV
jgi:glycine/D-amino acid oxidase-like deaminating enzyme